MNPKLRVGTVDPDWLQDCTPLDARWFVTPPHIRGATAGGARPGSPVPGGARPRAVRPPARAAILLLLDRGRPDVPAD